MKSILGMILAAAAGAAIGFIIGRATDDEIICCNCDCDADECPDFVEPEVMEEKEVEENSKEDISNVVLDDIDDVKEDK